MSTNATQNYALNQWEPSDKVLRTEFNADNAKVDAALLALSQRADGLSSAKADNTALAALSQRMDGLSASKADQTSLTALSQTVDGLSSAKADKTALSALQASVNGLSADKADKTALSALQTTVNGLSANKADKTALSALQTTVNGKADASALTALAGRVTTLEAQVTLTTYVGVGERGSASKNSLTFPRRPTLVFIHGKYSAYFSGLVDGECYTPSAGVSSNPYCIYSWSGNTLSWFSYDNNAAFQLNEKDMTYQVVALYLL